MGTGSFPGVKCGRGVLLTTHSLLVPRSWKSRAMPLPTQPLGHTGPVTGSLYLYVFYIHNITYLVNLYVNYNKAQTCRQKHHIIWVNSSFRRRLNEVFFLLRCYAASIVSWLPKFRDSLSIPSPSTVGPFEMRRTGCAKTQLTTNQS